MAVKITSGTLFVLQITIIIIIFAQFILTTSITIMTLSEILLQQEKKRYLFEYLVFLLKQWRDEQYPNFNEAFSKLKLHKILFLVAAVKATSQSHPLLEVFNNFYALPYGPVELDIYDSMNGNAFKRIKFEGNNCKSNDLDDCYFEDLNNAQKQAMIKAIRAIRDMGADYITKDPFELVDITHKWTSWQVAMQVAEMLGNKRELMSTEDIINSTVKAYK